MKQNWYAVYTKPAREKRVCSILTKKGIENYYPINYILTEKATYKKPVTEALFNSFVFVFIKESEMDIIRSVPDIVNFMFWKSKPAVIKEEEIELVKKLTHNYINIKLEKINVGLLSNMEVSNEPSLIYKEDSRSLKYDTLKVTLPSLGYTMLAEREKIESQSTISADFGRLKIVPKRANSIFSN